MEESIIEKQRVLDSVVQLVEKGTSEFLANKKMHIGDTIYVIENVLLLKEASNNSEQITEVKECLDVKLIGLEGEFCKVLYDGKEGYIFNQKLTSAALNPEIAEKNKAQKILTKVSFDMPLNQKSGLTLEDFKKVLSGNIADKNKIFENNAENFYNIEQKYNVNGIFLAAVGIHESAWGTSTISLEKKNLFGYGAYDRDPYNSSYEFEDNQTAEADHYNGSTLEGVNKKYSTDTNWCTRVYYYMQYLYEKLK